VSDPFARLRAANLLLQTRTAALRPQVVKRLKARRAALRPFLDLSPLLSAAGAVGSRMKTALRALARTWHEPLKLQAWRAGAAASLRHPAPHRADTAGLQSAQISPVRREP